MSKKAPRWVQEKESEAKVLVQTSVDNMEGGVLNDVVHIFLLYRTQDVEKYTVAVFTDERKCLRRRSYRNKKEARHELEHVYIWATNNVMWHHDLGMPSDDDNEEE